MVSKVEGFLAERFGIVSEESDILAHYASKYYDPAKAREYYLRTRELKGREPQLSAESRQRQREATAYVSNEIRTRRTADLAANQKTREQLTAAAQAQVKAHQARMEKLQKDSVAAREKVVAAVKDKFEKIKENLKIPENASPRRKAFLQKQLQRQMQTVADKAKSELATLQYDLKLSLDKARTENTNFRKTNTDARRKVATDRRNITESYRKDLETEKKNIKDNVR